MNQKKAKALRRAAKQIAARFPIHATKSYQDIVRQTVTEQVVVDETLTLKGLRILKRVFGKKAKPNTKMVEKIVDETRQTVLVTGWRFIQQRLKKAIRRDPSVDTTGIFIENPLKGQRARDRSYSLKHEDVRTFFLGDRATPGYKGAL